MKEKHLDIHEILVKTGFCCSVLSIIFFFINVKIALIIFAIDIMLYIIGVGLMIFEIW